MIWVALVAAAGINLLGSIFVFRGAKANGRTTEILSGLLLAQGDERVIGEESDGRVGG